MPGPFFNTRIGHEAHVDRIGVLRRIVRAGVRRHAAVNPIDRAFDNAQFVMARGNGSPEHVAHGSAKRYVPFFSGSPWNK